MRPEHKKFILKHLSSMTANQIARELSIKPRSVRRFLKDRGLSAGPSSSSSGHDREPGSFNLRSHALALLIIAALGFAVYFNSLGGEFIWDDHILIIENSYIRDWSHLGQIFTSDLGAGAGKIYNFYRPFHTISLIPNYLLSGINPFGYHLVNLIIHILAALSLYMLSFMLFRNRNISFLTGILFAVHPVHTEAVSYISSRADPLGFLLMLAAMILYIWSLDSKKIAVYMPVPLLFVLALLTKEGLVIFPVLLLIYHYVFGRRINAKRFLPIAGIALAFIPVRMILLRHILLSSQQIPTTVLERLPGFFAAVTNYTRLVFFPFDLHIEYGAPLFGPLAPPVIGGYIIAAGLLLLAVRPPKGNSLARFSSIWIFATLLPVSNIYPLNAYMLEHWLYLPSFGIFLLIAGGLDYLYNKPGMKPAIAGVSLALVSYFSFLTYQQNKNWLSNADFFVRTLRYVPDSYKMNYGHATTLVLNNRPLEALAPMEKALNIALKIGYEKRIIDDVLFKTAYLSFISEDNEKALKYLKMFVEANPSYAEAYKNMARIYHKMGNEKEAVASYKKAIELAPNDHTLYTELGTIYLMQGDQAAAMPLFEKAIELGADNEQAYFNIGRIYHAADERDKAIAAYEKGLTFVYPYPEKHKQYTDVHAVLAAFYLEKGQYNMAAKHADEARAMGGNVDPQILMRLEEYRKTQ